MSESEEENQIFEITDFTIVTAIEELTSAVETIIQKWNLYEIRDTTENNENIVIETKETCVIQFGKNKLKVELLGVREDPNSPSGQPVIDSEDDDAEVVEEMNVKPFATAVDIANYKQEFKIRTGLTMEFGVRECILLSPFDETEDKIAIESQSKTILGSVRTALHNSRCEVPVFLRLQETDHTYTGYSSDGTVHYEFTTCFLRGINKRHQNLYGLLDLFKEFISARTMPDDEEPRICSRFHHYFQLQYASYERVPDSKTVSLMPFGPNITLPIDSFTVVGYWRTFREDMMVENDTHTDFNIEHAHFWEISINIIDEFYLRGLIDKVLSTYTNATEKFHAMTAKQALGRFYSEQGAVNALDRLTGVDASNVKIGGKHDPVSASGITGPLNMDIIKAWINAVFIEEGASAVLDEEFRVYSSTNTNRMQNYGNEFIAHNISLNSLYSYGNNEITDEKVFGLFKAAKPNSLTWRIANAIANVKILPSVNARAEPQMWMAFVKVLREKYENNDDIDTFDCSGEIDRNQCVLAQKLQLLQACVVARRKRHDLLENLNNGGLRFENAETKQGVAFDEFYDASDDFNDSSDVVLAESVAKMEISPSTFQGRLRKMGDAKLLARPTEPLYIPYTQDPGPMTEEMIDEQAAYLRDLSSDERLLAQLDPLKSDMKAFKAANPGCVIGDFLRWHSPKDFDESTLQLSERMTGENNTWMKCWETSTPVAAINQTRLFNDTKLAEEIFENFENLSMADVRKYLKPVIFASAYHRLLSAMKDPAIMSEKLLEEAEKMSEVLQDATNTSKASKYDEVAVWMRKTEIRLSVSYHLLHLFNTGMDKILPPVPSVEEMRAIINELVDSALNQLYGPPNDDEKLIVIKPQDSIARAISAICAFDRDAEQRNRHPERKEYILNWKLRRPGSKEKVPQRMYACIEREFNKICFALGHDHTFFEYNLF